MDDVDARAAVTSRRNSPRGQGRNMKDAVRQSAHRFSDSNATTASTPSRQAADRIFADISCGELVKEQDPVSIPAGATVQEAFEILTSHGIHFAPVRAEGEEDSYTGVFTFRSICTFLLTQYPQHSRRGFRSDIRIANNTSSKAPIYFDLRRLVCNTVGQRMAASDFAYVSNFVSTAAEDPVRLAFEHFSEGWHRISILDENGKLFGVLSQSAVLRHYVKNIGKENLDSVFPESIEDLFPRCCRTSIFSVQEQVRFTYTVGITLMRLSSLESLDREKTDN